MDQTLRKRKGIHYTPPELAGFLANQTVVCLPASLTHATILDPACGEGQLLSSLVESLQDSGCHSIHVVGFDTDPSAIRLARGCLKQFNLASLLLKCEDFLDCGLTEHSIDCVIANPPYVRTQVLGQASAKRLSQKFNLRGRVDLYHAFAAAIAETLAPGGVMGLLTSNRFLTVRSGAAMRQLLREKFDLQHVFDLGDTRLFEAAVLPAVVTGVRREPDSPMAGTTQYDRIYRIETGSVVSADPESILKAVADKNVSGAIESGGGHVMIQRGELAKNDNQSVWTLENSKTRRWLEKISAKQACRFGDVAEIKVGIKTTADSVFIHDHWDRFGWSKPENELLRPLLTHHDARRWSIDSTRKSVLYPYDINASKRSPIELEDYPQAQAYFNRHRERLEKRKYLVDAGRRWYEIWVPHQPSAWAEPKIVWPDISEQPRFFLDSSGAIVNGDCYWIKLKDNVDSDWLYMMLAVANSNIATEFYDTVFHNKLYSGRRRYMTQYVKEFPLPELNSGLGKQIVRFAKRLVDEPNQQSENELKAVIRQAFGF